MRIKHTIWKVSNGYLLVPEDCDGLLQTKDASGCAVFKTLKEFSDWKPKRERRKRNKSTTAAEPQHTKD
jgi:hypothetical protein